METEASNNIIKTLHTIYNAIADEKTHLLTKANVSKIFFENSLVDIWDYNIFIVYHFLERLCPNTEEIQFEHFIKLIFFIYNQQIKQVGKTEPSVEDIPEITEMSEENIHTMINKNPELVNNTHNLIKVVMNKFQGIIYEDICYPDFNFEAVQLTLDSEFMNFISNYQEGLAEIFDEYANYIQERNIRTINLFDVINIVWKNNIANNLKSNNEVAHILQHFFEPKGCPVKVLEDIFDNPDLKAQKEKVEEMLKAYKVELEKVNFTFSTFVIFVCCCAVHYKDQLETREEIISNFEDYFINVLELKQNRNPDEELDMGDMSGNSFREEEPKISKNLGEAKRQQEFPGEDEATFLMEFLNAVDTDLPQVSGTIRETQNVLPNHSNTLYTNKIENNKFKFPINTLSLEVAEEQRQKLKAKEDKEIERARKPEKKDKKGPTLPIFWEEKPTWEKDKIKTFGHNVVEDMKQRFLKQSYKEVLVNNYVYPSLIREVLVIPKNISKEVAYNILLFYKFQTIGKIEPALARLENAEAEYLTEKNTEPQIDLFFNLNFGSIYESLGYYLFAIRYYKTALTINMKLERTNPDKALVYCALGCLFYHMREVEWAIRAFWKAKEIREYTLGGDTLDTATVYNNLGCCFYFNQNFYTAHAFFKLSYEIYKKYLGPLHSRTLMIKSNQSKLLQLNFNRPFDHKPMGIYKTIDAIAKNDKKGKK